ncbi:DUF7373 family lipoprotein [Mycobacterium branderi]|uniref:Lipoprotein n=1 Tax=Mycobacterium branderi TaxID=43348 RepID=A0A7I7WEZ2_9MYCO|nr:hypothetical protein [Mycobacterium branderi]MCV7236287.1 hypothetical protein [Mycobacterium branderi]ORA35461.1 hypothetical protein BST20_17880 [Mycobacterium branderi]BBZ15171.1 hypothetical protein MBRA_53660 [Mycobacterium branderi]
MIKDVGSVQLVRRVAVAAAAVTMLAGCGSSVVSGSPMTAPGAAQGQNPGGGQVDVASLNTGNYPTTPAPPLGNAGSEEQGRVLEAQRLANNVVGPWEVDPALVTGISFQTSVIEDMSPGINKGFGNITDSKIAEAAQPDHFLLGFASTRRMEGPELARRLTNAVLRFADPASAAAAAADMSAKALTVNVDIYQKRPMPIPGHSDAQASTYDLPDDETHGKVGAVMSFTPHGTYVLYQYATSKDGVDAAAQLISGTLDRQKPLIDRFYAADPAGFADLPRDPTGLLARVLPRTGTYADNPNMMAVFEPRAALNYQLDPIKDAENFNKAGVAHVAAGKTNVYETIDETAAGQLRDAFADEVTTLLQPPDKPAEPVPHLPGSKCFAPTGKDPNASFSCYAVADRYLIEASSGQLSDTQQQTAAQYRMLMAK